jgi:hypothetical protein
MNLPCFLAISSEPLVVFSIIVVLLPLIIFWLFQFVGLMSLPDNRFPGRFDKVLWVSVFVLIAPLAPMAFYVWNGQRVEESARETEV